MAFRIHFTAQDLARTHLSRTPMRLAEVDPAARALQDRSQPARLDGWRRRARARMPARARMALSLFPPVGWSFGGLPPVARVDEALDVMRAMPRCTIGKMLAFIAEERPLPSWARNLPDDPELFGRFIDGIADLYAVLLGPYERQTTDLFTADHAVRMRQLADGGVESLLAQASPRWIRWRPPVLEIRMVNGIDFDLYLEGQGLLLTPSMLSTRTIVGVQADSGEQPIVVYPIGHDRPLRRLTAFVPEDTSAISVLLGHTRATVLDTIADHPGCSTTELAALVGIAPATASEHATVLRRAGLINTVRHRNSALHSVADLGIALLNRP